MTDTAPGTRGHSSTADITGPPRPEALIHSIITLYEKVKGEKFVDQVVEK